MNKRHVVTSGVEQLDQMLGGLFIGDNVVWHDDVGSLADLFVKNFIEASRREKKPMIYVSFDRSPKNLLDKLGELAGYEQLIILDCFTCGRGGSTDLFMRFYENGMNNAACRLELMDEPSNQSKVGEKLYQLHAELSGDVRLVFESLTGMAELWGGEDALAEFYASACPHLYELDTIAYWVLEKDAHSPRLKARIGHIAQVVIDLSIRRGTTYLSVLKADKRNPENHQKPFKYWVRDQGIDITDEKGGTGSLELGQRIKSLRFQKGLSQSEMARLVGVTPSTVSQVESNLIHPSLPALLKMAEVLGVEPADLFKSRAEADTPLITKTGGGVEVKIPGVDPTALEANLLTPLGFTGRTEPYLLTVHPGRSLSSHFFHHKGEEIGYLLEGRLEFRMSGASHVLRPGDLVYLTTEEPNTWINPGSQAAVLLWLKLG